MKATFQNTVDILVKAYLNDTLQHDNCYACAVGNIIAHKMGLNFEGDKKEYRGLHWEGHPDYGTLNPDKMWTRVVYTRERGDQIYNPDEYKGIPKKQIDATGYTHYQIARIEYAFETASCKGDRMFNGLMAVVDVLAIIHNIDLTEKETAKGLFVKVPL